MAGFLEEKATEMLSNVMEKHGIEPGELLDRIERTLDIIEALKPVAEDMGDTTKEIEGNVDDLQIQIRKFNKNTEDMTQAMEDLGETLNKFHDFFKEIEEER